MINLTGPLLDLWPGRLHQGTTRCVISWLPVNYEQQDAPSYETINATIFTYTWPGLKLEYAIDGSYKGMVHIPLTEDNQYYNKPLTITFIMDERQQNYWAFWRYMTTVQSGQTNGWPVLDKKFRAYFPDGYYRNRVTYIPSIEIHVADDSFQQWTVMSFQRCYPVDLSDIQINNTAPECVTFTMSFVYSFIQVTRDLENPDTNNCVSR